MIRMHPLEGLPSVQPGDDLAALILGAAAKARLSLEGGALVICQKIVSKAEGRIVALADVKPSAEALRIAAEDDKDPRHVEVVLRETSRIVRHKNGVMICETHHGFVCANAGVDLSNATSPDTAILLPVDVDASARNLRKALLEGRASEVKSGVKGGVEGGALAVVVSDTFGRPWREGLVDVALGCAGMAPIDDLRGGVDLIGRVLEVTATATADQLAAAAGLLMPKASGIPAVWIEGLSLPGDGTIQEILRDPATDLFR